MTSLAWESLQALRRVGWLADQKHSSRSEHKLFSDLRLLRSGRGPYPTDGQPYTRRTACQHRPTTGQDRPAAKSPGVARLTADSASGRVRRERVRARARRGSVFCDWCLTSPLVLPFDRSQAPRQHCRPGPLERCRVRRSRGRTLREAGKVRWTGRGGGWFRMRSIVSGPPLISRCRRGRCHNR